ncbi:MAG: hypothetical protein CL928_17200 [Deltaproteobacteria bacterium]|nr:hypothetical protein [Deltaproteobacteria bacterium]
MSSRATQAVRAVMRQDVAGSGNAPCAALDLNRDPAMWMDEDIVDRGRLVESMAKAWARRSALHAAVDRCDAYRLMDGRHEGAPGWTVDRYGPCVLVQCFGRGGAPEELVTALVELFQERLGADTPVFLKERFGVGSAREREDGRQVAGPALVPAGDDSMGHRPGRLVVNEHGLRFGVDLSYGQNTGLFADARSARAWVRANSQGRRILNLFSYTGAFGVAASCGGARSVTNVDRVRSAIERGRVNYSLNQLESDSRTHLRSDVFDYLRRSTRRDESWDGIILDPPPRPTPGRRRGFDPRRDTEKLFARALELCGDGAWVLGMAAIQSPSLFDLGEQIGEWERLPTEADFPVVEGRGRRAAVLQLR